MRIDPVGVHETRLRLLQGCDGSTIEIDRFMESETSYRFVGDVENDANRNIWLS